MIPSRFRRTPFIARMATRLSFLAAGCADAADPPSAGDRASDSSEIDAGAADGRLRRVLGRRGDGPGEFQLPVSARRTLDGSVAVVDFMAGRFAFFPPAGGEGAAAQMVDSPVQGIMDIRHLEGDRYLLAGLDRTGDPGRFLHLWDRTTGRVERSFLPMGVPEASRPWASSYPAVATATEANAIWAVWALSDTAYQFGQDGSLRRRIPLPLPRPIESLPVAGGPETGSRRSQASRSRQTQVFGVFLLAEGDIAIQSMQARERDPVWDLLIVGRLGAAEWKARNLPRLYAVESVRPNRRVVARRRAAQ